MPNLVESVLVEPLLVALQEERLVSISTVDFETGAPNVSAISWVYAPDETKILLAVTNKSRIVQNIEENRNVVVTLYANESVYAIHTTASVLERELEELPLKLAVIVLQIREVRDVMFYGAKISIEPHFEKTYDKEAAKKLDKQVMDTLKTKIS
ncbi:pyridoxamine 5'-phosphate oxidase family protein [Sutcliffiella halmapala]|uniref:pyridoxamine 5'-phosphate oxidase family protein n=1 Tax=Sutcliffiella halmapala TaxID=79882 RepID=UPI000994F7A5|nr:pyridoxamine 5'-phosphate oxidase family protein [Sutcliffiella halmapala]